MAIRKNTRRFDPRYFMDEKTDVIKEGLNPANMNQTPFDTNPKPTKELVATIQSVAGSELEAAVQWFANRPSKEEDPSEYRKYNQTMWSQESPVHSYINAVDDAMRNNEIYDKLYPWASAGYEGLEGTLINLASWMAKPKPENIEEEKDWIEKAVNPEHEGYCTPMTKRTCTPKRKALAKRFKKAAKKKEKEGGTGWQGKV